MLGSSSVVCGGSDGQQGLDGAALVHRLVALSGLLQREAEVEDLARVDGPAGDQLDQLGQEAAHRGGAAVQVHSGEEQLVTGQGHVVGDPDVADVPTGAGGADGLHHRLLGADGLDDRVRAQAVGELLDLGYSLVAAGGDDVGRAELPGQLLPGLVPAEGDDPLGTQLLGGEHAEQADGAVTDDGDG